MWRAVFRQQRIAHEYREAANVDAVAARPLLSTRNSFAGCGASRAGPDVESIEGFEGAEMKKLFASMSVGVAMLCAACSGQNPATGPSPMTSAVAAAAPASNGARVATSTVHTDLTEPIVADTCKPPTNSVVFDPTQLGRVTITNNSSCANDFLYIVWDVSPDDETNQSFVAMRGARLAPGERRVFTLGFPEGCGTKYQRDVYIGVSDEQRTYTYSDMSNYFFAALGYYQYGARCDNQPLHPNPPIDMCPNLEGNQGSIPVGYALNDGVCQPVVTDVCPNIEGVQATVPNGYTLTNGVCILVPPPPPLCTDRSALNFNGPAPCAYPPPQQDCQCGPFSFSGPISTDVPNGAPGRLAYARSFGPAYSNVVEVHPPHGGSFSGNNHSGFTFTPSQNFAVLIFHHQGGRDADDVVYTGVIAGVSLNVPSNGADVFYFNCPQ